MTRLSSEQTDAGPAREDAARYRALFRSSMDAIYLSRRDGRILDVNPAFVRLLGYSRAELQRVSAADVYVDPGDRERFHRAIGAAGAVRDFKVRLRHRDGGVRHCLLTSTARTTEAGVVEYQGIIRDVTEQRRARARLARTTRALRRSNAELEQFAYVASHDLQEPLRKIRAFGDRLSSLLDGELDDRAADYLRRMVDGARRMQTLIDTLLLYSRVSSGPVARRPVDLGVTVAEVVDDLGPAIDGAGAELDIGPLPTIEADPVRMRQLFQNLIGNAVKYARDSAPPRIRLDAAWLDERHRPVPANHRDAAFVRIRVEDNGIGFEPAAAERIFELFQRLHGRDEFEGTGIGLAVCRRIVARHHGTLSAHGAPGEGATFTVVLPRSQERDDDD